MDVAWTVCVCGSGDEEEEVVYQESQVTEELVEEHLVRVVTRDLLDLISKSSLCVSSLTLLARQADFQKSRGTKKQKTWH